MIIDYLWIFYCCILEFSTSWLSKHALDLIAKGLKEKGIEVVSETFYLKSKAVDSNIAAAEEFAKRVL